VVTDPQTHKQTQTHKLGHRQDRLQYTAPQLASAQCNKRYAAGIDATIGDIGIIGNTRVTLDVDFSDGNWNYQLSVRGGTFPPNSKFLRPSRLEIWAKDLSLGGNGNGCVFIITFICSRHYV